MIMIMITTKRTATLTWDIIYISYMIIANQIFCMSVIMIMIIIRIFCLSVMWCCRFLSSRLAWKFIDIVEISWLNYWQYIWNLEMLRNPRPLASSGRNIANCLLCLLYLSVDMYKYQRYRSIELGIGNQLAGKYPFYLLRQNVSCYRPISLNALLDV